MKSFFEFDNTFRSKNEYLLCGIDEAGRGPLAGPVVAAAVVLPVNFDMPEVRDSKKLSEKKRNDLYKTIIDHALSFGIGVVHERKIDEINILNATYEAMKQAIGGISIKPHLFLIDGNPVPFSHIKHRNIIQGDTKSLSIASASILAKVVRDDLMKRYSKVYPYYGFEKHKGYGTKNHLEILKTLWATPIHRQSFKPVKSFLPGHDHYKSRRWLGKRGEQLAASSLIKLGNDIIAMNYNVQGIGEIDIIHMEENEIVFTEVKTGYSGNRWGEPIDQIDRKKRDRILETAEVFLSKNDYDAHVRFDVISVQFSGNIPKIKRIKRGLAID
jgi:uncharacterized protein (TIGR00252 family)